MDRKLLFELHRSLIEHFLSKCSTVISQSEYPDDKKAALKRRLSSTFVKAVMQSPQSVVPKLCLLRNGVSVEDFLLEAAEAMKAAGNYSAADKLSIHLRSMPCRDDPTYGPFESCLRFLIALSNVEASGSSFSCVISSEEAMGDINSCDSMAAVCSLPGHSSRCFSCYSSDDFNLNIPLIQTAHEDLNGIFSMEPASYFPSIENLNESEGNGYSEMCVLGDHSDFDERAMLLRPQSLTLSFQSSILSPARCSDSSQSSYSSLSFDQSTLSLQSLLIMEPVSHVSTVETISASDEFGSESNLEIFPACVEILSSEEQHVYRVGPLSWESAGRFPTVKENLRYFTECGPEVFDFAFRIQNQNSDDEEPQDTVSSLMVSAFDARRLLTSIPSSTFSLNHIPGGAMACFMKQVNGITRSSFESGISDVTGTGMLYSRLMCFAKPSPEMIQKDVVETMLRRGVYEYLLCFESCVAASNITDIQPVHCLNNIYREVAENIRSIAKICGFSKEDSHRKSIPLGTELISYLYQVAEDGFYGDANLAIWLLVKYSFKPFLSFLSSWLFEGGVENCLKEFHLQIDAQYAEVRTEEYWKKCYFSNTGACEDIVPIFLRPYATQIFNCGKSLNLLKCCIPQHPLFNLESRTPCFQLGFSEKSVLQTHKKNCIAVLECINNIIEYIERSQTDLSSGKSDHSGSQAEYFYELRKSLQSQLETMKDRTVSDGGLRGENAFSSEMCFYARDPLEAKEEGSFVTHEELSVTRSKPECNVTSLHPILIESDVADQLHGRADRFLFLALGKSLADSEEDEEAQAVINYLRKKPISSVIRHCISPLLLTQIELVNKCVLHYFFIDLKLWEHFEALSRFFLLRDGEFGRGLNERLFQKVDRRIKPSYVFNNVRMSVILQLSLSDSIHPVSPYEDLLQLCVSKELETFPECAMDVTENVKLHYKVPWPCNVIITEAHITSYGNVTNFLLQIRHVFSCLSDVWFHLKGINFSSVHGSPQYRGVEFCRHSMLCFMNAIQSYLYHQLHRVLWKKFQNDVQEVQNIDQLSEVHAKYVGHAVDICMLNKRTFRRTTSVVRAALRTICIFCDTLIQNDWQVNEATGLLEHCAYNRLMKEYTSFMDVSNVLYRASRQKYYQKNADHIRSFMLLFNFNRFYHKKKASVY